MSDEIKVALAFDVPDAPLDLDNLRRAESESLLQHLVVYRGRMLHLLDRAEEHGDYHAATRIYAQLLTLWEREARLLGEIMSHTKHITTNITISPEFMQLRVALVRSLERHPEARADVLRVLTELEQGAVDADFAEVAPARLTGPDA